MSSTVAVRPDDPVLADEAARLRGAYVHIPFCARVCPYCDFAVVAGREDLAGRYLAALGAEIEMEPPWAALDAVHIGGGTPTQLPPAALAAVVGRLVHRFGLAADAEVALEANPEDWSTEAAERLAGAGIDRVSFGAQSFDSAILRSLGRRHQPEQVEEAVVSARRAGIRSVSLDLIFGTPGETLDGWLTTVARALATGPDHLSVYALTVERGTPLSRSVVAGSPAPDPDLQADMYLGAVAAAEAAGLVHYEVSNLAVSGHHSRYNLLTWAQGEYLAFGNGAHGHRAGARRRNVRRLDAYLERVEEGRRPEAGVERADPWARETERLMLGLRRRAGVMSGPAGLALLGSDWGERLVAAGVIVELGGRIVVTRPLLGDEVNRAVLALAPLDC